MIPLLTAAASQAAAAGPAVSALMDTWEAAGSGSSEDFLASLAPETSEGLLLMCGDYLDILRSLPDAELFLLFAAMRIDAAPGEVDVWDSRSVLELLLTAPSHAYLLENSIIVIDSLQEGESLSRVYFTLRDPYGHRTALDLPIVREGGLWRVSGIDTLMTSLIEGSFFH